MVFEIEDKIALITGGVSGIGLACAKELLRNAIRGVVLVDINLQLGNKVIKEIEEEFGPGKAIFIEADVSDKKRFEEAFQRTISEFNNIDILINNAGIVSGVYWEKEIKVNLHGVIHGMLLAFDNYLSKYKSDAEGVIVNVSSVAGIDGSPTFPTYSGTKFAIIGLTKSWGIDYHYNRSKVRVVAVCPGATETPLLRSLEGVFLGPPYEEYLQIELSGLPVQESKNVGAAVVKIIKNAKTGTVWVSDCAEDPYKYVQPKREDVAPK